MSSSGSLQKTSPTRGPAAYEGLHTTMAAQASQIAANQFQLNRLTSITEELVKAVQSLHTAPAATPTPEASAIAHVAGRPSQVRELEIAYWSYRKAE